MVIHTEIQAPVDELINTTVQMISMAKWQRCHGVVEVSEQSKMDDCKQNNKHKKGSFSKTHNWGEQLIKVSTKLKWTTFSASLPHTCFSKHQFQDKRLSLFLLSNRWYTGRERGSKRVFYLVVSSTTESFLWAPQQQTDGL